MKKIIIDQRADQVAYITLGDWVVYVDNSTNEKIIETVEEQEDIAKTEVEN
tara:strand:+ start:529 stop:681 length:153 start_codon:yes stop_codon:yes gene_type:complete